MKTFSQWFAEKVKARFCARDDLQEDVDVFDKYAPVASWSSIRMLTVTAMQKGWITRQIDFSNAFVQAPMARDVYVSLPAMFCDAHGLDSKALCLKLKKSLYGLREAPKLWHDWLEGGLAKAGFQPSDSDLESTLGAAWHLLFMLMMFYSLVLMKRRWIKSSRRSSLMVLN